MRGNRTFDTTFKIAHAQEHSTEKRGGKGVKVMNHRKEQGRDHEGQGKRQYCNDGRPHRLQTGVEISERKKEAREDEQTADNLLSQTAVERQDERVVVTLHLANVGLN